MYHFLYKTTNIINGKNYIGAHSTDNLNDGYLGSGKQIKDAIKKYGKDNFRIEILEHFDTREAAFAREAEVVTEEVVRDANTYNMMTGGLGGSSRTPELKEQVSKKLTGRQFTEEHRRNKSLAQTGQKNHRYGKPNPNNPKLFGKDNGMYGKSHSIESKSKMSQNRKLAKIDYTPKLKKALSDACSGKLWYNNGTISKRFKEGEQLPGFVRGRI